jgi:caffeoyl-CoA O-methyltransferase
MADNDSREGKRYTTPQILKYVDGLHAKHDSALAAAFDVPEGIPAIQVGPNEGKLLTVLMKLASAKKVVEIGTLIGYSAIRLAAGLAKDGHLWTIEFDPKHAEVARRNIERAGYADRITVIVGPGVDVLPTLEKNGPFDAVFLDADKENYDRYGKWAVANLRQGGLVIGDNTYLFGDLMEDSDRAKAMRAFHEYVASTCESVSVPTPDGMLVGMKK